MSDSTAITNRSNSIDLEAIAWVYNEIEQLLNQTQRTLRSRLRVLTGERKASEAGGADQSALRDLHSHLVNSIKALELVNMPATVQMLSVIANAVDYVMARPEALTPEAVNMVDRACFALIDLLQQVLKSKDVNPIGLFPQYKDVAGISKQNVQPSDMWHYAWKWRDVEFPGEQEITQEDLNSALSRLDKFMLSLLRGQLGAAADFRTVSLGLAQSAKTSLASRFWSLAAGFFDAITTEAIPLDIYTKRAASHILNIYKSYTQNKFEVSDSFAKELLFFCANRNISKGSAQPQAHPLLDAVLKAYDLKSFPAVNYEEPLYGRIDPAQIQLAQKRITTAKGTWSSFSSGGPVPVQSVAEAFSNLCLSLRQIIPGSEQFSNILASTVSQLAEQGQTPSAELAMEIATSVLYVEAIFSNLDLNNANLKSRFDRLTERIAYVAKGNKPLALDSWIEDLYRHVSDRETMGNVVGELRNMLGKVELNIDAFLRKNESSQVLSQATIDLQQMYGVLSVLGLDEAAKASSTMIEQVNWLLRHESDASAETDTQRTQLVRSLSNSLGALGFLVDMLGYQPLVARQMFVYDAQNKELKLLVDKEPSQPKADDLSKDEDKQEGFTQLAPTQLLHPDSIQGPEYAATQIISSGGDSIQPPLDAMQELQQDSIELLDSDSDSGAEQELTVVQELPEPSQESANHALAHEDDQGNNDLRDIFLEEAHEVIEETLVELKKLEENPSDHDALLAVRRGFHTLKGSSRMVGLMEFGAAAWACEQCFNEWIAANVPIPKGVLNFAHWAFEQFSAWTNDLQKGQNGEWTAPLFENKVQEVRVGHFDMRLLKEEETHEGNASDGADDVPTSDEFIEVSNDDVEMHDSSDFTDFDALNLPSSLDLDEPQPEQSASETVGEDSNLDILDLPSTLEYPDEEEAKQEDAEKSDDESSIDLLDLPSTLDLPEPVLHGDKTPSDADDEVIDISDDVELTQESLPSQPDSVFPDTQWLTSDDKQEPAPPAEGDEALEIDITDEMAEESSEAQNNIKVIGSLEVDAALYNVYIEEALGKVEKLKHALLKWQTAGDVAALEQAKVLAHTMAGSSATVGYISLSGLAKGLEHGIEHYRKAIRLTGIPSDRSDSLILWEVSEELHRLLDQFASEVLEEPNPELVNLLNHFNRTDFIGASPDQDLLNAETAKTSKTDAYEGHKAYTDFDVSSDTVQNIEYHEPEFADTQSNASAALLQLAPEDRCAVGSDLFEIFAEEVQDLLPRISEGLRQWSLTPSDIELLPDVLRALHTLKGSSRLAGAMRLGNMSHELESTLKNVENKQPSLTEIQNILNQVDDINGEFEMLCRANIELVNGLVDRSLMTADTGSDLANTDDVSTEGVTADHQPAKPLEHSPEVPAVAPTDTTANAQAGKYAVYQLAPSDRNAVTSELFAIFQEEAEDLLPNIGNALQQWTQQPLSDGLSDMLRTLHTLKGSARLAGAMRLGGLAHDMESALKEVENEPPSESKTALIQDKFVQIEAEFELLSQAAKEYEDGVVTLPFDEHVAEPETSVATTDSKGDEASADNLVSDSTQASGHTEEQPQGQEQPETDAEPLTRELAGEAGDQLLSSLDAYDRSIIGTDVFKLFRKEATRLMPEVEDKLLQWRQQPESGLALVDVLKLLNTLRDHIKLARPKRLGNVVRQLDVALRKLIGESPSGAQIEEIRGLFENAKSELSQLCLAANELEKQEQEEQRLQALQQAAQAEMQDTVAAGGSDTVNPETEEDSVSQQPPAEAGNEVVATGSTAEQQAAMPRVIKPTTGRTLSSGASSQMLRVRASLIDDLVTKAGEVNMLRGQLAGEARQLKDLLTHELTTNLERLRAQLRDIELQAETQMASRMDAARAEGHEFDPLEFDRYTRIQELTRIMAESVNDVATAQKTLLQTVTTVEDGLAVQSRSARDLQHLLLRARMVEFSSIEARFHRIVRLAARECNKNAQLTIQGGEIEVDRAVLDHIAPAFEHILRNCVVHGIEPSEKRLALGKPAAGQITITLHQEGNDVSIIIADDGSGLDLEKIRKKAEDMGIIKSGSEVSDYDLAQMIYKSGLTTTDRVTELAGRGIGLDMAHAEIVGLGGRIEVLTQRHEGTQFRMILPLTTAVTQVALVKVEDKTFGIPINLIESIQRFSSVAVADAIRTGKVRYLDEDLPVYWLGGLLDVKSSPVVLGERSFQWLVLRSAGQQIVVAVDHVIGSQEVVIKNVGPQFAHLTGFSGMTVLSGGRIVLMYNPVALARVFGDNGQLADFIQLPKETSQLESRFAPSIFRDDSRFDSVYDSQPKETPRSNKVMVVDDSLTVRRVTQRLLERDGFHVVLAKDGQDALNQIEKEIPALVLSDIEMPRMDGFEFVRQLRSKEETQLLPVIMITSRIAQKHHDYANELGVSHYLGKPFVEEELLKLVHHYVKSAGHDTPN